MGRFLSIRGHPQTTAATYRGVLGALAVNRPQTTTKSVLAVAICVESLSLEKSC